MDNRVSLVLLYLLFMITIADYSPSSTNHSEEMYKFSTSIKLTPLEAITPSYVANEVTTENESINTFRTNWTKYDILDLLSKHGYQAKLGSEGQIFGMIGDLLYYPEDILPELGMSSRKNLLSNNLWLDANGNAKVDYFFDSQSQADQKVFEEAVNTWATLSCIKFTKGRPNTCNADLGHGAVCVGDFGGCFSLLGRKYSRRRRKSQQMSVMPDGCEMVAAAHELGHALGFNHEMSRADRDDHIRVNFENIDIPIENTKNDKEIRGGWYQGGKCAPDQVFDFPKPYDPMSLMQYGGSDFAMEDSRPVYLHKNGHYQYMFNYHRPAGYAQTHYDLLITNIGYKCIERWKKACEQNGRGVPKCENFGYVKKNCKCACPVAYSGATCGTKIGPIFPVQDRAKAQIDVTKPGMVDLAGKGMKDGGTYPAGDSFLICQFIGVYIRGGEDNRVRVLAKHDFKKIAREYVKQQQSILKNPVADCQYGLTVYVGDQTTGFSRTECISSLVNNELLEGLRVFTSRTSNMDIVGMTNWGISPYRKPSTARQALEFKFIVSFFQKPEKVLEIEDKYPGDVAAAIKEATKKFKKVLKKNMPVVIIVAVAVVVLIGIGVGLLVWCIKAKKRSQRGGSSDSDSSEYSSDEAE